MRRAYLDHAATTPMFPEAIEAVNRQLTTVGNPASLHGSGRAARRVVEEARESIAERLGAMPAEVVFTSGGTEADNLAIKGGWWSAVNEDPARRRLVISTIEHHAVLDTAVWLRDHEGADTGFAGTDERGVLDLERFADLVGDVTALVSVMWANNEVGTVQPVSEIAEVARRHGAFAHSDAVQAVGHGVVDFAASGLDLMSCTAHKLGGPVGVGALLVRRGLELTPVLHGGGQERDVRSGTVDAAAVTGFAAALELADDLRLSEDVRLRALRAELTSGVRALCPDAMVNTPTDAPTLPGVLSVTFPGCEADAMLMLLDAAGIDCATGSACSAGVAEASHVLLALGRSEQEARSTLRFSLGHSSTAADIELVLAALPETLVRVRRAGSLVG